MEDKKSYSNMSIIEIVFSILKANGQAMDFRELMEQAFQKKGLSLTPQSLASIYTEMSMDNRFISEQGKWGLSEWRKDKVSKRTLTLPSSGKERIYHRLSRKEKMNDKRNWYDSKYKDDVSNDEEEYNEDFVEDIDDIEDIDDGDDGDDI